MFNIWKKLRQKLIAEGSLRKYLLYAVGEIILVMVGILLAVQVNNTYGDKQTIAKQKMYLALVLNEMQINKENLSIEDEQLKRSINGQRNLIYQIDSLDKNFDENSFSTSWSKAFSGEIKCPIESSALSEIKFSGVLKDIQNDSIRLMLASLEGRIQKMRYQEQGLKESRVKCNNFMETNGSFRTIFNLNAYKRLQINQSENINSNKDILHSEEFENMLLISMAQATLLESSIYPGIFDFIQKTINLIETELE